MKPAPKILTIVPYDVLPANNGGRLGIALFHNELGKICDDQFVSTMGNGDEQNYHFTIHRFLPNKPSRYLPFNFAGRIGALGKKLQCNCIICEHPYMSFTAMVTAQKLRVPWFIHSHNIEAERFRTLGKKWWRILSWYEGYAMRKADGIFFVTTEDAEIAIERYGLDKDKCHITPYGTIKNARPGGHLAAKALLAQQLDLDASKPWLYFIGDLGYEPNRQAVEYILYKVLPHISSQNTASEILVAGKNLSPELQAAITATNNRVRYLGFVPDLEDFLNACDIMINPVLTGGGIKTKAVEALGYNKMLVTTQSGAAGIMPEVCGANMIRVPDGDWKAFADAIATAATITPAIPDSFYQNYYWGNIAQKAAAILQQHING
jgi:glycosyltransferase involved in cell wall biosynthesis